MKLTREQIKKLENGDDYEVREWACDILYHLVKKSDNGEISLADFSEEIQKLSFKLDFICSIIKK